MLPLKEDPSTYLTYPVLLPMGPVNATTEPIEVSVVGDCKYIFK